MNSNNNPLDAYNLLMDEDLIEEYTQQWRLWQEQKSGPAYTKIAALRTILYKRGWKLNGRQDLWEKR